MTLSPAFVQPQIRWSTWVKHISKLKTNSLYENKFQLLKQIAFVATKYNSDFKNTFQISKTQFKFQKHSSDFKNTVQMSQTQFKFQKHSSNFKNTVQISKYISNLKNTNYNSNFKYTFQISKTKFKF